MLNSEQAENTMAALPVFWQATEPEQGELK